MTTLRIPTITPPQVLYRVGRASNPFWFSEISPEIDPLADAGNRFDVLGAGVMYAATTRLGALTETLQFFRPTTKTRAAVKRTQPGFMTAGAVPADWRANRRLASLSLTDPAPFVDLENPLLWPVLEQVLADELAALEVTNLDISVLRGPNRRLTRLIATWSYLQDDPKTEIPRYGGIRYLSKLGSHECWAIFDGCLYRPLSNEAIELADPDYQAVCATMDLLAH